MSKNVVFVTNLYNFSIFITQKKEVNRSTLVELFISFLLDFTDVFSKLSVNQLCELVNFEYHHLKHRLWKTLD